MNFSTSAALIAQIDNLPVPPGQLALWSLGTFCFESFDIFPRLGITSPVRRCGKSTLLEMLEMLINRALSSGSITAAATFRVVEAYKPSLLIDEIDTFPKANPELRGIINLGHKKGAVVIRTAAAEVSTRLGYRPDSPAAGTPPSM
jgi:hypothetical protein